MPVFMDLAGQVFGRLTVIERAPNRGRRTMWSCRCSCGNLHQVNASKLRDGATRSCGCLWRESLDARNNSPENLARLAEYGRSPDNLARLDARRPITNALLAESARSPENRARMAELGRQQAGPAGTRWLGDSVGIKGAHDRVRRARGPASDHTCIDCPAQAAEWSYDEAPGEHSPRIEDYSPRCYSCHKRLDNLLRHLLGETG